MPTPLDSWFEWRPLGAERTAEAFRRLLTGAPGALQVSDLSSARAADLPFYSEHDLIELEFEDGVSYFGLHGSAHTFWLEGESILTESTATEIHAVGEIESLTLTEEVVVDYLRFFLCFLQGGDGHFVLIESGGDLGIDASDEGAEDAEARLRALRDLVFFAGPRSDGDSWLLDATFAYRGVLFRVSLTVSPDGNVQMLDDEPLADLADIEIPSYPSFVRRPVPVRDRPSKVHPARKVARTAPAPRSSQAAVANRAIRVFVSSTFRDMQAERDLLGDEVFPRIRDICERRGVSFSEIDLRWGLTDEEVAEGKVLPICLSEIERCRPYFIGMLGERYGWVPDEIPEDLGVREQWLIGGECAWPTSVTEMEILHGALRKPNMAEDARFYLRDPAYVESDAIDDAERRFFMEEPTPAEIEAKGLERAESDCQARRRKLRDLKQRLVDSPFPAVEYSTPADLARRVQEDLEELVDRLYPKDEAPDPLAAESRLHEFFARNREAVYVDRPEYSNALEDFASEDAGGVLTVLGESGRGKSALLATWALGYRSEHSEPATLVLMHFIGSSAKSAELSPMLSRLNYELERYLELHEGLTEPSGEPEKLDELEKFKKRLAAAGSRGKVILVLDALNQLKDEDAARELAWLPTTIPDGVRVVASTLPGAAKDELDRRGWTKDALRVRQLGHAEREELINRYLARLTKSLPASRVDELASLPQAGNPLYLRVVLDELRRVSAHEPLDARIAELAEAASIPALLEMVLERYEATFDGRGADLVRRAMSFIWASRQGLEEGELRDLLGSDDDPLPAAVWSPLRIAAADMFIERGGLIDFAHDFFRQAVEDRYLGGLEAKHEVHRRLADYMATRAITPRALEELPAQLAALEAWPELAELLADPHWLSPLWERDKSEVMWRWARIHERSDISASALFDAMSDEQLDQAGTRFLIDAARLLENFGSYGQAERLLQRAERICRRGGSQPDLQEVLLCRALIHRSQERYDSALALLFEQEGICRDLDSAKDLWKSLGLQASTYDLDDKLSVAMCLYREVERLYVEIGDRAIHAFALAGQASLFMQLGDDEEEKAHFEQRALDLLVQQELITRDLGDLGNTAASLSNQGRIFANWGKRERALELHGKAADLFRSLGDMPGLVGSLDDQAGLLDDRESALGLYREQEEICKGPLLEDPDALQAALGHQALIHRDRGDLHRAMELLVEEEGICRDKNLPLGLQFSLAQQALIREQLE